MKRPCVAQFLLLAVCLTVAAQERYGTVYLYREIDTQDYGRQIVILNSEALVYIRRKGILLNAGADVYRIPHARGSILVPRWKKASGKSCHCEANQNYYLRITQSVYPYLTQFISGADEKTGLEAIRKCYTLKEKKIRFKSFEAIRTNPNSKKKSRT